VQQFLAIIGMSPTPGLSHIVRLRSMCGEVEAIYSAGRCQAKRGTWSQVIIPDPVRLSLAVGATRSRRGENPGAVKAWTYSDARCTRMSPILAPVSCVAT